MPETDFTDSLILVLHGVGGRGAHLVLHGVGGRGAHLVLHGVGGRGAHLEALAEMIAPSLPGARLICPDAPLRYDWDDTGRQWFSVKDISPRNRPARLRAARAGFDAVLAREIAAAGFADRLNRVALVGFSQGAIMATDAVMSGRWPVAGLAALSGRLVKCGPVAAHQVPVMLSHGRDDPVIPASDAIKAMAHWQSQGHVCDLHLWQGLGHWFDTRTAAVTANFLRRCLLRTA
ncbi:alpha/beta hydrolase [Gemmobacter serpentinus]|uniref:alpha/beta hydrolase n=1 Tax=Gemmobacter serpentinus TaxID=2652247 RepID=UPI0018657A54|nr:dienelactone hydrolase family protein [Gemmobacter serpentinus]